MISSFYIYLANSCELKTKEEKTTRSSTGGFDFKHNLFLCGQVPTERERRKDVHHVSCKHKEVDIAITNAITERQNDPWAVEVKGRLEFVNVLRAEDAIYHGDCNTKFRCGKPKPGENTLSIVSRKRGRPVDEDRKAVFEEILDYLIKNDDEQITLPELQDMMAEKIPAHSSAFTCKHILKLLKERLGDQIIVTSINGKSNVVTFRETASKILSDFKKDKDAKSEEEEKYRIVQTAAKFIKSDIKNLQSTGDFYPILQKIWNQ